MINSWIYPAHTSTHQRCPDMSRYFKEPYRFIAFVRPERRWRNTWLPRSWTWHGLSTGEKSRMFFQKCVLFWTAFVFWMFFCYLIWLWRIHIHPSRLVDWENGNMTACMPMVAPFCDITLPRSFDACLDKLCLKLLRHISVILIVWAT